MRRYIVDLLEAILEDYEVDEEIETKILEDLKDGIENELYERQTILSTLADAIEDDKARGED